MSKKTLISGLAVIMALVITACGSSKEQESAKTKDVQTGNVQNEIVQNENVQNEAVPADTTPEPDIAETETTDEIPHFEATDEIKNASMQQFKVQVADMVFDSFHKVPDYIEKIENSELPFTFEYNPDKLVPVRNSADIEIYLHNELYMTLHAVNAARSLEDSETRTLSESIVCWVEYNDYSNIYYAGGIAAVDGGISAAEFDERMQTDLNYFIERNDILRSEHIQEDSYHIDYDFTSRIGSTPVLECDGAVQQWRSYTYRAVFNETGTELKSLKLDFRPVEGRLCEGRGITDYYTIIER